MKSRKDYLSITLISAILAVVFSLWPPRVVEAKIYHEVSVKPSRPHVQKKSVKIKDCVVAAKDMVTIKEVTKRRDTTLLNPIEVSVTFYNPVKSQCSGNPTITADGSKIPLKKLKSKELRWIAVSRDLQGKYPFGSKVYIEIKGYPEHTGVYEVHDLLGDHTKSGIKIRHQIDVLWHQDNGDMFPEGRLEKQKMYSVRA